MGEPGRHHVDEPDQGVRGGEPEPAHRGGPGGGGAGAAGDRQGGSLSRPGARGQLPTVQAEREQPHRPGDHRRGG